RGILGLFLATIVAGLASYGISQVMERVIGNDNLLLLFIELSVASAAAIIIFSLIAMQLKLPESNMLLGKIKQKLGKGST
ncbi:MAG: murein biosynthesis integral membrane protein MurJ, partial [Waterburya sp.]